MDTEKMRGLIKTLDCDYTTMKKLKENEDKALRNDMEKLAETLFSDIFRDYEDMYVAREISAKCPDTGLTVKLKAGGEFDFRSFFKIKPGNTLYVYVFDNKDTISFVHNRFNGKPDSGIRSYGSTEFMKGLKGKENVIMDLIHVCMEESTKEYIEYAKRRNNELNQSND